MGLHFLIWDEGKCSEWEDPAVKNKTQLLSLYLFLQVVLKYSNPVFLCLTSWCCRHPACHSPSETFIPKTFLNLHSVSSWTQMSSVTASTVPFQSKYLAKHGPDICKCSCQVQFINEDPLGADLCGLGLDKHPMCFTPTSSNGGYNFHSTCSIFHFSLFKFKSSLPCVLIEFSLFLHLFFLFCCFCFIWGVE